MTDPLIGRIIGERYRLEACIGSGGMGTVYQARHLLIDREVAIKLLRMDRRSQEHSKAWFVREARAVNRVNHSNIADIYDLGETEDGLVYLVMELLRGATLTREIDCGPMKTVVALQIIEQISRALARAHDLGVIHRDLKPDNVFLLNDKGRAPNIKLIDFGLARLMSGNRLAAQGTVFGTAGYLSPEQIRGEEAGPQADLYAVGVILYEMVTGRPPFDADDVTTLLDLHANEAPCPPRHIMPEIDQAVEAIVLKLLNKNLEERYHDAYHLLDDCRAARTLIDPRPRSSEGPFQSDLEPHPVGEVQSVVATWALRAAIFGRMAAVSYPGGGSPQVVTKHVDVLWRQVAELSRIEGELQVTQTWDDNLRQRAREFNTQVSRQIEDLSKASSSLHREVVKGRSEQEKHMRANDLAADELSRLRSAARQAEDQGTQDHLWAMLQAAGAAAAREQIHLGAITLVEQKIEKWERDIGRVEAQAQALRRQIERHSEQVEHDLELGRPRFSALLENRGRSTGSLVAAASQLVAHFRPRPGCAALLLELGSIPSSHGEDPGRNGEVP